MNFSTIIEKIKDIISKEIGDRKVLNKDVAKVLGITPENLSILKSRNRVPYEEVLYFCAKKRISINWMLFEQDVDYIKDQTEKFSTVRYFRDINASAGGGAFNNDEEAEELYIDTKLISGEHIDAINVTGDSMEPLIKDGSIIFIDRDETRISNGGIFVISTPHGVFVKRINLRIDGTVELISENTIYPIERIASEEIQVVGKVVYTLHS